MKNVMNNEDAFHQIYNLGCSIQQSMDALAFLPLIF